MNGFAVLQQDDTEILASRFLDSPPPPDAPVALDFLLDRMGNDFFDPSDLYVLPIFTFMGVSDLYEAFVKNPGQPKDSPPTGLCKRAIPCPTAEASQEHSRNYVKEVPGELHVSFHTRAIPNLKMTVRKSSSFGGEYLQAFSREWLSSTSRSAAKGGRSDLWVSA